MPAIARLPTVSRGVTRSLLMPSVVRTAVPAAQRAATFGRVSSSRNIHTTRSIRKAFAPSAARLAPGPSAAPSQDGTSGSLTPQEYHEAADATIEELQDRFDAFIEAVPELVQDPQARNGEWDIEAASGVINVTLGQWGTYVINKQPATQQVWLSSPLSGPYRMDYAPQEGKAPSWVSHREEQGDVELWALFRNELARIVGEEEIHSFFDAPDA